MQEFTIDLAGRIKNFSLPKRNALLPLYEAVVNSFQAIEDRLASEADPSPEIIVTVKRETVLSDGGENIAEPKIKGFKIFDNGIGFDENNFCSFLKSDSQYKSQRGGKGIGRFCWLKAFAGVRIESNFQENGQWYRRAFDFNLGNFALNDTVERPLNSQYGTTVELIDVLPDYLKNIPSSIESIASSLMYHCLVYLNAENAPSLIVEDQDKRIFVNDLLSSALKENGESVSLAVCGGNGSHVDLNLLFLKFDFDQVPHGSGTHPDKLILCAHNRSVREIALDNKLNGLTTLLHERGVCIVGVVSGDYLNENVDMNRLSFSFPEEGDNLLYEVSERDIEKAALDKVFEFLHEYKDEADLIRERSIEAFIKNDAPQYKPLVSFAKRELAELPYNVTPNSIDDALHQAKRRLEKEVKSESDTMLDLLSLNDADMDNLVQRHHEQLSRVAAYNYTALAEYVIHRKTILDLFEKGLHRMNSGKFNKESYLHNLIYPMRSTSEDVGFDAHNLWLIDERLTYSSFISSDRQLRYEQHMDRPDIVALDSPVLMSLNENDGRPFDSVIIFELKKPMRDDYNDSDNPITQLLKYARQIKSGASKDANGRPIKVSDQTRMYLYAVCDITPSLEPVLENFNFSSTPDGLGMYTFNDNLNAYIEVMSFDKIVNDAKMRNEIFFDKLGISI